MMMPPPPPQTRWRTTVRASLVPLAAQQRTTGRWTPCRSPWPWTLALALALALALDAVQVTLALATSY